MAPNFERRPIKWLLLILLILVAAALRFNTLGVESVWDGEIFSLLFARYDWTRLLPSVSELSAHPPLWFIMTKVAITWGWNEWMLRFPAAFAGIASVPALYVLGTRVFNARVGFIAAALLAVSPLDVLFSQNARMYSLFVLLVIVLWYAAWRVVQTSLPTPLLQGEGQSRALLPSPRGRGAGDASSRNTLKAGISGLRRDDTSGGEGWQWWLAFTLTAALGLYTHYLFVLPLGGTVLAVTVTVALHAARASGGWIRTRAFWRELLTRARPLILSLIGIPILYLPWLPTVGHAFLERQLNRQEVEVSEGTLASFEDLVRLAKDLSGTVDWGLYLFVALFLLGVAWTLRQSARRRDARSIQPVLFFGMAVVLPIAVMIVLAPRRLPIKYVIYALPVYLLFVAQGIAGLASLWAVRQTTATQRAFGSGLVFGLIALLELASLPNVAYWNGTRTIFEGKGWMVVGEWADWRDAAQSITSQAAPGDFIMLPVAHDLAQRSIQPYFDEAFHRRVYLAPLNIQTQATAWWVSIPSDPAEFDPKAWDSEKSRTFSNGQAAYPVTVERTTRPAQFVELPVSNGSFEQGMENWRGVRGELELARDDQQHVDGNASLRVTLKGAEDERLSSQPLDVTPGKLFRVTAYTRSPVIGFYTLSPQLLVSFYDERGEFIRRNRLTTILDSDHPGWGMQVYDGIVPSNAKTMRVAFVIKGYARQLGPTSWIDDVRVWMER